MTDPAKPAESREPTPVAMRAQVAHAAALQGGIDGIQTRLRDSEKTRHTAFRLDDATNWLSRAGQALGETAGDLTRTRGVTGATLHLLLGRS